MGHELAHYYKDHGWIGDFGSGFTDLEVGQEMKALRRDLSKLTEIETEADYFGGFFGYVAGYETLNAADRVLDQIYSTYGLDENLKGYPSLSDRKIIADRSREDLKALMSTRKLRSRSCTEDECSHAERHSRHRVPEATVCPQVLSAVSAPALSRSQGLRIEGSSALKAFRP